MDKSVGSMEVSGPFVLKYSSKDFIPETATWDNVSAPQHSRFDKELCGRWDDNMKKGVFKYTLDHVETRILPGPKKYVAQLNDKRATERRKPQAIMSVNQPFDSKLFNFTKIGDKEILFYLHNTDDDVTNRVTENQRDIVNGTSHSPQKQERHIIIINISPLEYGHVLIVPQVDNEQPQVLIDSAVKVGLECMLLSQHRGFKLGFNSLCAYASVNHLHFHAYYLEHELMVEYCDVDTLGHGVHELTCMPCPGFAFQLHGFSVRYLARLICRITQYFQEKDIAHNLFVTRGVIFGEPQSSTKRTIRLFLWPRQKFVGIKVPDEFNVAVIELGGHLPIKDEDAYQSLTEEVADNIIADVKLPAEEYKSVKDNVLQIAKQLSEDWTD